MGFYLRKSFKVGGLRFNLSNSGVGVSTGIKGLRVGVDGKGRGYLSGGVGALRYRESLNTGKKKASIDKNLTLKTETDEISKFEIPKELQSNSCFITLMVLGGIPAVFCGIMLLFALFVDWESVPIFFWLVVFFALPFITLPKIIRASITNSAVYYYNHNNYEIALNKFLKLKEKLKRTEILANMFVTEKIYQCYIKLEQTNEALDFLLKDIYMSNKDEKIIFLYYVLEQYENLINHFNEVQSVFENVYEYEQVYNLVFNSYIQLKRYQEALELVQKIPYIIGKNDKIIICYYSLKDYKALVNFIQKQVTDEEKEEHPKYYAMLGEAFMNLNQEAIALECMLDGPVKKRTMTAEMCAFRYTLGKCYEVNNDKANALKQYQKVYAYDLEYEDVALKIEELKRKDK